MPQLPFNVVPQVLEHQRKAAEQNDLVQNMGQIYSQCAEQNARHQQVLAETQKRMVEMEAEIAALKEALRTHDPDNELLKKKPPEKPVKEQSELKELRDQVERMSALLESHNTAPPPPPECNAPDDSAVLDKEAAGRRLAAKMAVEGKSKK